MKILFVAAESYPFIKVGGLGDVVGSLPLALKKQGHDVRVMIPKYGSIPEKYKSQMGYINSLVVPLAWRKQFCTLEGTTFKGVPFYFVDNSYYFNRTRIYGYHDDAERFAFLSRAALYILPILGFKPDIIHCHDWHTGLLPVFLKDHFSQKKFYHHMKTILTIHNLKFQGVFPENILEDILGLDYIYFKPDGVEFFGQVNFLKGGLIFSDIITTVSNNYAEEITTPEYGEQLHGVLKSRSKELFGIMNGLDYEEYNPETDPYLYQNFSLKNPVRKIKNKLKLQQELGLPVDKNTPVISVISRLYKQKGIDLLVQALPHILSRNIQFILLGTGDKNYELFFKEARFAYGTNLSVNIKFDNELARKIYAGSDIFLMPSLFEPCGLGQLIAMRYGTIPIVRKTGGLKDSVKPFDPDSGTGNGFLFDEFNSKSMLKAIDEALTIYKNKNLWNTIRENNLKTDFSWKQSALKYQKLYKKLINVN
ncbi:glycogen synthase GlgA [Halothermothrix orenii]|uniref:Glycogen synthase n=1 Tax=Halothermothrix orenii (strain H 168 / OCM 544 / DSM 9562) TaxID=373903 RepID=B8CVX8_HALOH|nr:glycogen synthase GlgA [Halothermothrix orenii]ACL69447.1 glycogen/starch synthase, ADP-glucose type [Halothermothrix orenii H 168]